MNETKKEIASQILEQVVVATLGEISMSNYFKMRDDIETLLINLEEQF